jgi:hypothetical protein
MAYWVLNILSLKYVFFLLKFVGIQSLMAMKFFYGYFFFYFVVCVRKLDAFLGAII